MEIEWEIKEKNDLFTVQRDCRGRLGPDRIRDSQVQCFNEREENDLHRNILYRCLRLLVVVVVTDY